MKTVRIKRLSLGPKVIPVSQVVTFFLDTCGKEACTYLSANESSCQVYQFREMRVFLLVFSHITQRLVVPFSYRQSSYQHRHVLLSLLSVVTLLRSTQPTRSNDNVNSLKNKNLPEDYSSQYYSHSWSHTRLNQQKFFFKKKFYITYPSRVDHQLIILICLVCLFVRML